MKISSRKWSRTQQWEQRWWQRRANYAWEREKHFIWAALMGLPTDGRFPGKRLLDIGCGPTSMLLRARDFALAVGVDPLRFSPHIERRYRRQGIVRMHLQAEAVILHLYDEVWCYNCLQHVQDPHEVWMTAVTAVAPHGWFRLVEWLNVPSYPGHPHSFRARWFTSRLQQLWYPVTNVIAEPVSISDDRWRGGLVMAIRFQRAA